MMLFMSSFCWLPIQVPPECSVLNCVHGRVLVVHLRADRRVAAVAVPGDAAEQRVVADRRVVQQPAPHAGVVAVVPVVRPAPWWSGRRPGSAGQRWFLVNSTRPEEFQLMPG